MSNVKAKKLILFPNINGEFEKFSEIFFKIKEKSGAFDIVILSGNVFNLKKDFSLVKELEKLNTKFLIFDQSEVGIIFKHKQKYEHYHLSDNVTILGRSGIYNFEGLQIVYLNGRENKKYLSEEEKYKYTSSFFSREDIDNILTKVDTDSKTDVLLINGIPSIIYDEMIK